MSFRQPKGLTLGGTGIGDHPGDEAAGQANADALVAAAWDDGIRYFDVAPMYGAGKAERWLGRALAAYPRDQYVLSSKVGRLVRADDDPAGPGDEPPWRFDFSADGVRRSVEASLERLGTDHLDIAHVHDPDDHLEVAVAKSYPALEQLRDEGLVRRIGAGVTRVPTLLHLLRAVPLDVALLAGRLSLVDDEAQREVLPLVAEQGVELVIAAALQAGLVDGRDSGHFHYAPTPPDVVARVAALHALCKRHATPLGAVALQAVLALPEVAMVLTGPADVAQWRQNLAWSRQSVPTALWEELFASGLVSLDLARALLGSRA